MSEFIQFLETMPFWYWWVLALALLGLEVMTGSTYLLWPGSAAIISGLTALWPLGASWPGQVLVFAITTIALTIIAAPRIKPWLQRSQVDHEHLNERGARKVGRRVNAVADFQNGNGKVYLDDTQWLAETDNGGNPGAGSLLEIIRTEGTKLIVKLVG